MPDRRTCRRPVRHRRQVQHRGDLRAEKVPFGFQVEYGYNGLAGKDATIPLYATPTGGVVGGALIESHHTMHYVDFNGMFKTPGNAKFGAYGIGGGGMYYRIGQPDDARRRLHDVLRSVLVRLLSGGRVDRQVIGDRSSWDPGINFGGGVTFRLGTRPPSTSRRAGTTCGARRSPTVRASTQKANGQYLPDHVRVPVLVSARRTPSVIPGLRRCAVLPLRRRRGLCE